MIEIIAQKAVFGGDCIGKIDGKTVFIGQNTYKIDKAADKTPHALYPSGALPGETVEIDIVDSKKDYDKAVVTRVLKASKHRIPPFCPLYGRCGGCNFQYADYAYQVELKKSIVEDIMQRSFGKDGIGFPPVHTVFGPDTEYRSRFQFYEGGLKERNSHTVVPLDDCPCAVKPLRTFLQNGLLKQSDFSKRVNVFADERLIDADFSRSGKKPADIHKVVCASGNSSICTMKIAGKRIAFDVNGFFQSNMPMLEKTLSLISGGLCGERLLDMYGGTGILSLFAAAHFTSVTIVESDKRSVSFAKQNYRENGIQCALSVQVKRGRDWALEQIRRKNAAGRFDAVIIDPPRTGMEKEVTDYLCMHKPPLIRSLSCDPATHARDLKRLAQAGYTIEKLYMLDFYPHTSHIETLAFLNCTAKSAEKSGRSDI
ncbi:class I SAM-dependent RNA methyltransferase [Treponema sp. OMZ 840]|uniref:class I SAM-dependent RNA methyltransferase n=1 Tax=Treponema sp. OMZ 840 TaxID=244313 RepID=UPI003D8C6765